MTSAPDGPADNWVDLRSDTVTRPTPAMRRAMADAVVGDDNSGEDPTVNELQAVFAERVGCEAALFVPSGTMANQIALRILGTPGTAIVAGRTQHVVGYEAGAAAINAPVQFQTIPDDNGSLDADTVDDLIAAAKHHRIPVSAVFIENTHMHAGGVPWELNALEAITGLGVPVHVDGARLFNAEVATGVPAAAIGAQVTTLTACLSKGLGAPIGSLLAGAADLMEAAWLARKRLGGGMRQAGVIAAAGLVALRDHVDRLADDHRRAHVLAEAVADRWPDAIDPGAVRTNIVAFRPGAPEKVVDHLRGEGVLAGRLGRDIVRLVTHLDVDDTGIERARRALATAP